GHGLGIRLGRKVSQHLELHLCGDDFALQATCGVNLPPGLLREHDRAIALLHAAKRLVACVQLALGPGKLLGNEGALSSSLPRAKLGYPSIKLVDEEVGYVGGEIQVSVFDLYGNHALPGRAHSRAATENP